FDSGVKELETKKRVIKLVSLYSKLSKLHTSFVKKLPKNLSDIDDKLHTEFKQVLRSGRMAGKNPNLMQLPRDDKYELELLEESKNYIPKPKITERGLYQVDIDIRRSVEAPEGYIFAGS